MNQEENYIYLTSPYENKKAEKRQLDLFFGKPDYNYTVSLINGKGEEIWPMGFNSVDCGKQKITWPTCTKDAVIEGSVIRQANGVEVARYKLDATKHLCSGDTFRLEFDFNLE